jgi:hypothetical protein
MHSKVTQELMSKVEKYYVFDGKPHFKVEDVKEFMPDMKINPAMIKEKSEEGKRLLLVSDDALSEMTEFDKKIRQSLHFNPKK